MTVSSIYLTLSNHDLSGFCNFCLTSHSAAPGDQRADHLICTAMTPSRALLRTASCLAVAALNVAGSPALGLPTARAEPSPGPNAGPAPCPYQVSTPAAVDSSEVPKAG